MSRFRTSALWRGAAVAAALAGLVGSALADESVTELAIGGLSFAKAELVMDSEDLTITPESVAALYRFHNTSATPVTVDIAFPLPDIDFSDPDTAYAIPGSDPQNFVGFRTSIDGKPVALAITQRALVNDRDVTPLLRQAKLNLLPVGDFSAQLEALDPPAREKLRVAGVLAEAGADVAGRPLYAPAWTLRTTALRKQTFAPGQSVAIDHRYRTSLGARQDTALRKPLRDAAGLAAEIARYRQDYCIDDSLLLGVDKLAGTTDANAAHLAERRIALVLRGSNSPVHAFRLVVDKGRSDRLVSFCLNGLTKISPTAFEMKAADFVPQNDLKILLIGRF